jgi:hypothetical protein
MCEQEYLLQHFFVTTEGWKLSTYLLGIKENGQMRLNMSPFPMFLCFIFNICEYIIFKIKIEKKNGSSCRRSKLMGWGVQLSG